MDGDAMKPGRLPWHPHWADLITLTGIILTINEAVFRTGAERPGFQFMFLAMMGVSPAARIDERRHQRKVEQQKVVEQTDRREEDREAKKKNPLRPPGRFDK